MESLIDEGFVDACLDITTTEWADELCGGVFTAGPDRLSAPGRRGIPHLIVPGCIDMVNFGPIRHRAAEIPRRRPALLRVEPVGYADANQRRREPPPGRNLRRESERRHRTDGVLIPLRGVSILDGDGQPFCDREADQAMFAALRQNLRSDIPFIEVDANINDPVFARKAVDMMLKLMNQDINRRQQR